MAQGRHELPGATREPTAIASAQATDAASYTVVVTNVAGSITNIPATLTVNVPPSIGLQSSNQTVNVGAPASFFVVASGTAPLGYQWRKDGTNILGATSATNAIAAAQATDAGSYTVVVTNVAGSITNIPATLTVNVPPSIGLQSSNQTVNVGVPVSFFVVASGTAPFGYQWRKDGTNLVGATSPQHHRSRAGHRCRQLHRGGDECRREHHQHPGHLDGERAPIDRAAVVESNGQRGRSCFLLRGGVRHRAV